MNNPKKTSDNPSFDRLVVMEKNNKKLLGTGGYASVRLVKDPQTDRLYALKEVDRLYVG